MNNKGFTLIELLATIAILGLLGVVTMVSVTAYFDKSKDKMIDIFNDKLVDYTMDYISLNGTKGKIFNSYGAYYKCYTANNNTKCDTTNLEYSDSYNISVIEREIVDKDLVNPVSNIRCSNDNLSIRVYRDSDYVYCTVISPKNDSCIDRVLTNCNNIYKVSMDGEYKDFTK